MAALADSRDAFAHAHNAHTWRTSPRAWINVAAWPLHIPDQKIFILRYVRTEVYLALDGGLESRRCTGSRWEEARLVAG